MTTAMRKINGGQHVYWVASMPPISITQQHLDAIRSGDIDDDWFGRVVDLCFAAAREDAIKHLRGRLQAEAALRLPVVDRRPSRLVIVALEGKAKS